MDQELLMKQIVEQVMAAMNNGAASAPSTPAGGKMTAVMTMSGTGYDKMFVGTKSAAQNAKDGVIDFAAGTDGAYTFTVPVAALDTELPYAAHGVRSGNWFDRTLTFDAASAKAK